MYEHNIACNTVSGITPQGADLSDDHVVYVEAVFMKYGM